MQSPAKSRLINKDNFLCRPPIHSFMTRSFNPCSSGPRCIIKSPCLPSHLVGLEQYRPIPFNQTCLVDLQIVSHTDTSVVADIQVIDSGGKVYVKFFQLQGTISPLLKRFIGVKPEIKSGESNA